MEKVPTLFVRDPDNMARVLPEVTDGCEWVLAGEGVATRKVDGVCVRLGDATGEGGWWARREVKPGKTPPDNFEHVAHDPVTGKDFGWEPLEQTGWVKYVTEAVENENWVGDRGPGTYELVGPKVNGNPENMVAHGLVRHGSLHLDGIPRDFAGLRDLLTGPDWPGWEGIVWWRDVYDRAAGMAKLKTRDFPRVG